ncbi:zinc finger BED domain-containing protein 4-like isoform X2 [Festucalex cinctus]
MREWKASVGQPVRVKFVVSDDDAAIMVEAFSQFGPIPCAVTAALEQEDRTVASLLSKARRISGYIRRSSRANELQTQFNLPRCTLITDKKARQNDTFYMLQWLVEQRSAVQMMAQD